MWEESSTHHLSSATPAPLGFLPVAKTILAAGQSPAAGMEPAHFRARSCVLWEPFKTSHLHQDTLLAGLECNLVPTHTRVTTPGGQRPRCHFLSALQLAFIFLTLVSHYFHTGLDSWKDFCLPNGIYKNGECVSCLAAL